MDNVHTGREKKLENLSITYEGKSVYIVELGNTQKHLTDVTHKRKESCS